ncbi:MAG: hypothetical protein LBQ66_12465, partial [Planctomycetaceae bacterium]|nr:hypothetical protein [Planctomycetaceae bacterium]
MTTNPIEKELISPPRDVSILVQIHLLLNNRFAIGVGWFFACFGMIFCIMFLPAAIPNLIYWNFQPAGKGEIIDVQKMNFEINEQRVFKFSFKQPDSNTGQSYTTGKKFKNGDSVKLERSGSVVRIVGTRLSPVGRWGLFFILFPIFGLVLALDGVWDGLRAIQLLRSGIIDNGRLAAMTKTGNYNDDKPEMNLQYQFTTANGETEDIFIKTDDTKSLTIDSLRPLLYDPFNPKISVFLDVLPAGVRFDEMKNTFTVNP